VLLALLIGVLCLPWRVQAQEDSLRPLTLETESFTIRLDAPSNWVAAMDDDPLAVDLRSASEAYLGGMDWQRLAVRITPLAAPLGDLPPADPLYAYMQLIALSLPLSSEYPPSSYSEIVRLEWGGYPTATLLTYSVGSENFPAYYARWVALQLSADQVLLIQQGTSLPAGVPPEAATLAQFDAILASLTINGTALAVEVLQAAWSQLADPIALAGPPVASLRLRNGLEVRLSAPMGWQRRDVTRSADYPTSYFFEDDLRQLEQGQQPRGAYLQLSLLDSSRLKAITGLAELPPSGQGELALAYVNSLIPLANPNLTLLAPIEFDWTDDYHALLLPIEYPSEVALHPDGTRQHLLLVESANSLILLSFYAPSANWESAYVFWEGMLGSLTVNGSLLPSAPLQAALRPLNEE
jgi:hypothetical protein